MKSVEERLNEMPFDPEINQLEADESLRRRILSAAREKPAARPVRPRFAVLAAACVLVLVLGGGLWYEHLRPKEALTVLLTSQPAGEMDERTGGERGMLDVKNGSVSISNHSVPAYRSVWAQNAGGKVPVIGVRGRYYRLLNSPASVSPSQLGEELGSVEEYTSEPALSGASLVSNVVEAGRTVYAVRGMNGAAAAAEVNGVLRVFQRVSYAGAALMGGESLRDTLQCGGVSSLELSGVGRLSGGAAREVLDILLSRAAYQGSGCSETGQSLLIYLDNGLTMQLSVSGETLQGCGTWACPDFFTAFYGQAGD